MPERKEVWAPALGLVLGTLLPSQEGVTDARDLLRADSLVARITTLVDPEADSSALFDIAREARRWDGDTRARVAAAFEAHRQDLVHRVREFHPKMTPADCPRLVARPGTELPLQRSCSWAGWIVEAGPSVPLPDLRAALVSERVFQRHAALCVLLEEPNLVEGCRDELRTALAFKALAPRPRLDPSVGQVDVRDPGSEIPWQTRLLAAQVVIRCAARLEARDEAALVLLDHGEPQARIEALRHLALFPPADPQLRYRVIRALTSKDESERGAALTTLGVLGVPAPDDRPMTRTEALSKLRRSHGPEEGQRLARILAWDGPTDADALQILDRLAGMTDSPRMARAAARIAAQIRASW